MSELPEYYQRWQDPELVNSFASKTPGDFFDSEKYFLSNITKNVTSVLDIGCAGGRFADLFHTYHSDFTYTGVDIAPENIERAKSNYPDHTFHLGNAIDYSPSTQFDLVNATGVFQHEPRIDQLLSNMVQWSKRYVLLDAKFAPLSNHIIDISKAYAGAGTAHKLYFNLLSASTFLESILAHDHIKRVEFFGYETKPNNRTVIPADIRHIASGNLLIELQDTPSADNVEIVMNLPPFLWKGRS